MAFDNKLTIFSERIDTYLFLMQRKYFAIIIIYDVVMATKCIQCFHSKDKLCKSM